jgi:hypothetical protein
VKILSFQESDMSKRHMILVIARDRVLEVAFAFNLHGLLRPAAEGQACHPQVRSGTTGGHAGSEGDFRRSNVLSSGQFALPRLYNDVNR